MRDSFFLVWMLWVGASLSAQAAGKMPGCRAGVIEGELRAGEEFTRPIGNGLRIWFQPIASGWILRVVPVVGPVGAHDYAELATPPYQSVSPLSVSTDFAFRAQDAVGWNPRRFRFATSAAEFERLSGVYQRFVSAGVAPSAGLEGELSKAIGETADGTLTIIDAKLVPGMADQWRMAGAVSSRFTSTAHTFVEPADGRSSALGRLVWVRFRVEVALPAGFKAEKGMTIVPHLCGKW